MLLHVHHLHYIACSLQEETKSLCTNNNDNNKFLCDLNVHSIHNRKM